MAKTFEKYGIEQRLDRESPGVEFEYGSCSSMYVATLYSRNGHGFAHGSFNSEIFDALDPATTGFVLSASGYGRDVIDHAPEAAEVLIGLGLVPDGIDTIVAMDRRGDEDFAMMLLEGQLEAGAAIIWDGMDGSRGHGSVIACEDIARPANDGIGWSRDPIEYRGKLTDGIIRKYLDAVLTSTAEPCREIYELMIEGQTMRTGRDSKSDPDLLGRAVRLVTLGKASFRVEEQSRYFSAAAEAVDGRHYEMERIAPWFAGEYERAKLIARCYQIWDAMEREVDVRRVRCRGGVTEKKALRIAHDVGIDHMIDALIGGVPVEDVVA